jgi:hypothetical protein
VEVGKTYLNNSGNLIRKHVKEADITGDASSLHYTICLLGEGSQSVNEGDDDVLDIYSSLQLCARFEKCMKNLQVEFIWKHLQQEPFFHIK